VLLAKLLEWHLQSRRQLHGQWSTMLHEYTMLLAKMHELYMPAVTLGR
jgi:hypothetical protein